MRRQLRTSDAIRLHVHTPHGRVWSKRQLDVPLEIDSKIDLARFAVRMLVDVFQRKRRLLWTTTQRTQQVPLKVEQADPHRTQADFQDETSRHMPVIGQFVCANTTDVKVVGMFEKVCETICNRALLFDQVRIGKRVDQLLMERLQPRQVKRRERSVGLARNGSGAVHGQLVILANRLPKPWLNYKFQL